MLWKNLIIIVIISFCVTIYADITIVKNGKAEAEIVAPEQALSSIKFAAKEIQQHIEKISGAKLPVVNTPTAEIKNKIYVGESKYTKKLGVNAAGLKMEGFRIVAKNNAIVIIGRDKQRLPIPTRSFIRNRKNRNAAQKKWQMFTGEKDWTLRSITTARNYDPKLKFCAQDATGTLYGAYDFLELLGVRWYMPGHDFGTVIPKKRTIVIPDLNISKSPEFPIRYFHSSWGNNKQLPWFKRQKLGWSYIYCCNHFLSVFMRPENLKKHPEYFAKVNGKYDARGCTGRFGRPKLSSIELRKAATKYVQKMFDYIPDLPMMSMGMPDGFGYMGDADAAAGWDTEKERGRNGKMSDYVWDFNKYIADRLEKSHPGKYLSYLAYHAYLKPPLKVDKLNKNIALIKLEKLGHDGPVKNKWQETLDIREQWFKKLTSGKFYVWDHWLFQTNQGYPRIPAVFTSLLQKDMLALHGKCEGKFVEIGLTKAGKDNSVGLPALNHLMYYIQAKLYWNPDLDMKAMLDEYYKLFYGPASPEMKEFFEFSEKVWMRPGSRGISLSRGFLKPEDIDHYFDILKKAKAKTERGSNYYKRIELLENEMSPLKNLFDDLKRTGPIVRGNWATGKMPKIDGDLTKPFWLDKKRNKWYRMKNNKTGKRVADAQAAFVAFRKARNDLIIGIKCNEDKMASLAAKCNTPDNSSIFNDDVVEIYIETPQRSYFKIVINPNGTLFDECTDTEIAARETKPVMWTPGIKAAAKKGKDSWSVEIAIPLKDFGSIGPSRAHPWGINVCRTRFAGGKLETFALSPTGGRYADLSKMANFSVGK